MKKLQYIFLTSLFLILAFNCIDAQTVYTVTKTTDPDPFVYPYKFDDSECDPEMLGTLQWAIRKSNDTGGACIINFDIETPAPYKIRLNNYLPVIDSRITLDGTTQAGYVEGTPIINIEANTHITTCFSAYGVDELTIKGFLFHNFISCGISLENCNYSTISDNIITLLNSNYLRSKIGLVRLRLINCTSIDVYNNQFLTLNDGSPINGPDNYGIAIYRSENCTIGADLNSNLIEDCATGIMLDDSQNIRLIQNVIYGGINSIVLNNGSNNNKREAFLLNYIAGTLNGVAQANDIIEVFSSDDEDDATAYLGTAIANNEGKWSLETTNDYFFFTATATDANNNTSELCNVGTTNSICSIPFNLSSTSGIDTTHTLSWETDNPGVEVQIAVGVKGISALENEWMFVYTTLTGNSITLNGFDENTVYEFYVQEICDAGVGHFVGPFNFNDNSYHIPPPVIINYNNGILSGTSLPYSTIEVFGSTGLENANEYLSSTVADENGDWIIEIDTNYEYLISTQSDSNGNSSTFSNEFFLNKYLLPDCPLEETCNLICNGSMTCLPGDNCGYYGIPSNWVSAHGSCDWCSGSGNEGQEENGQGLCDNFTNLCSPPDPEFIYMGTTDGYYHEGIMALLSHPFMQDMEYELSCYINYFLYNLSEFDLHIRLVSSADVEGSIPINNNDQIVSNLPIIVDAYGVCLTLLDKSISGNEHNWENIIEPITTVFEHTLYDAIWIYATTEEGDNHLSVGFDMLSIKRVQIQQPAQASKSCYELGETIQLSAYDPIAVSYAWTGPEGWTSDSSNPTRIAENLDFAGTYTLTVIDQFGCEFISSTDVVINDLSVNISVPNHPESITELTVCPNIDFILNANTTPNASPPHPYEYHWNTDVTETTYSTASLNINGNPEMTYTVTVTDENGCSATDYFTINYYDLPETPIPGNTGPYCIGEDVELYVTNPNPNYQYSWNHSLSFWATYFNFDAHNATRTNAQNNTCCEENPLNFNEFSGDYFVTVLDENGCKASTPTYVKVYADQSCLTASTNSPVCTGVDLHIFIHPEGFPSLIFCDFFESEIILEGEYGIIPYELNGSTIVIATDENIIPETIHITINSPNGCQTHEFDIAVTVNESPTVSLPYSTTYCAEGTVEVIPVHSDFIVEYTWSGPSYSSHTPVANFDLPVGLSGQHHLSLTVTDQNDCSTTATMLIDIMLLNLIEVVADYEQPACIGGQLQLTCITPPSTQDYEYHWEGPDDFYDETQNPEIYGIDMSNNGIYTVTVTLPSSHCTNITDVMVEIMGCYTDINLECNQIPATCRQPFNGAVEISIFDGNPPYNVQISRGGFLLSNTDNLYDGEHTIDLPYVEPNEIPIIIEITDGLSNTYYETIQEGLSYAWDLVLTNNNLHDQNNYENMVLTAGDSDENQNLDFHEDFNFTDCIIYTGTNFMYYSEDSEWNINIPNTVTFENCTINSGCPDFMWQGITVNGIVDITDASQNAHIVFNNSSISDAKQAIRSFRNGTVVATNSTFNNNVYGIWLYDSNHDLHQITNNNFITDRKLRHNSLYPQSHVFMYKVRDLEFKENEFKNTMAYDNPDYVIQKRGSGIRSYISSYIVTPFLEGELYSNKFEGLYYGVNAKYQCDFAPEINYCDFVDNYRGVHMMDLHGANLLFNDFYTTQELPMATDIPGLPVNEEPETTASYAAYINSCTDYQVEENTAKNLQTGFYIYNSGDAGGQTIYRNKFGTDPAITSYDMEAGTVIVGKNSDFNPLVLNSGHIGLEIRCNDFTSTTSAIGVVNGNMRINQGSYATNELIGNQFHKIPLKNGMDFGVQIDLGFEEFDVGIYDYFHHFDPIDIMDEYYRELDTYTSGKVSPEQPTIDIYDESNTCLTHFAAEITPVNYFLIMQEINLSQTILDENLESFNNIVDNGDTEYMLELAEGINKHNFRQYASQLDNNGYLSDLVFEALLDNNSVQKPVVAAILIANSPLPVEIMEEVENSNYLSNGHKNMIRNYQSGINPRVLLEYEISDIKQEIAAKESYMINNAINNDTVPNVKDNLISYFVSYQQPEYNKLINIYRLQYSKGDYLIARETLADIEDLANSDTNPNQSAEYTEFCNINNILLDLISKNSDDADVLQDNRDMLYKSALDGSSLYSATAQLLYELAADTVFCQYTPLPIQVMGNRNSEIYENQETELLLPFVGAYPNPTNGIITIEYDFTVLYDEGNDILLEQIGFDKRDNCEKGELAIYTEDGKLLQTKKLNRTKDDFTMDLKNLSPGIYLVEVTDCYGNKNTLRISKYR